MLTGVLSDTDLLAELAKGADSKVVITPFNRRQLSNTSYDVTLGNLYYREDEETKLEFFNPWHDEDRAALWEKQPREGFLIETDADAKKYKARKGDRVIIVPPRQTILAHTNEYLGGRVNVTTMMKARSTMGRCCVTVCKCAGWGDINYINRWTMEIENTGPFPLVLLVGQPIAQIVFLWAGTTSSPYEKKGSYQGSSDVEELKAQWTPTAMLPRLKRLDLEDEKESATDAPPPTETPSAPGLELPAIP
ncbi:Hypothetical protein POVN_LOCUS314 [uncultured virus]|nr:Hypothetical protein POVN_LOCUS314 [uncultured virus]